MTSEYRYNAETKLIETIPFDPKQNLEPTIENLKLIKDDNAKFFISETDVSEVLYKKIERIYQDPARHKEELSWQSLRLLAFNMNGQAKPHPPQLQRKAFSLMKEGISLENIHKELDIPIGTLKDWSYKLKNRTPVSKVGRFNDKQRDEMRKFIEKNKGKMTGKEIANTLGISESYIWCLMSPDKMKANLKKRRDMFKGKPACPVTAAIKPEYIVQKESEPKMEFCKECKAWEKKHQNALNELAVVTSELSFLKSVDEQKRNTINYDVFKLEQSEKEVKELKEQVGMFMNMLNKVIK